MTSLRHLLGSHENVLVIDAASSRVQVGWLAGPRDARWRTSDDEAGIGVFRCIEQLGSAVAGATAFVFCEGPGSILGIRAVAMAVRTWCVLKPRPVYAYASLAIVAHSLNRPKVGVIADARRNSWHHYRMGGTLRRVSPPELTGELVMPEHFRHWSPLPPGVRIVPYSLPELFPRVLDADLFHPIDAPDAFLHEEPSYVTWTPQIHRAPSPS